MAIIDPSGNGKQHNEVDVPTEIVVTITLKESAGGLALNVAHDPHIFPDTVIEMCHRVARLYERDADKFPFGEVPESKDGEIVLVLTNRFTRVGMATTIEHDPLLPRDTVIDACLRTARFYERMLFINDLGVAQQQAVKRVQSVQKLGDVFRKPRG